MKGAVCFRICNTEDLIFESLPPPHLPPPRGPSFIMTAEVEPTSPPPPLGALRPTRSPSSRTSSTSPSPSPRRPPPTSATSSAGCSRRTPSSASPSARSRTARGGALNPRLRDNWDATATCMPESFCPKSPCYWPLLNYVY